MTTKTKKAPKRTKPETLADARAMKAIRAAEQAPAGGSAWFPQVEGDAIGGVVLSMREEQSKFGPRLNLILDTPKGPKTVFCNKWLENCLEREGVKAGDRVGIVYKGERPTGRGRPSKAYTVARI
jgi:hypothetical protein